MKNTYLKVMAFKDSTDEKFSDQIGGSKLSLIQFSASWCELRSVATDHRKNIK